MHEELLVKQVVAEDHEISRLDCPGCFGESVIGICNYCNGLIHTAITGLKEENGHLVMTLHLNCDKCHRNVGEDEMHRIWKFW